MPLINMIELGFTEREYYEEFTIATLGRMAAYYDMRDKAMEVKRRREKNKSGRN